MSVKRNRRNYYRILHVQPDAPAAVVKSSYRAMMLSLEMHPDRGGEHWNAALINEAYGILSDPAKRERYDQKLDLTRGRNERAADGEAEGQPPGPEQPDEPDRVAETDETKEADEETEEKRYAEHVHGDGEDEPYCVFCGSEQAVDSPLYGGAVCLICRSPLTPAGAPQLEASGQRAARRVAKEGRIQYYVRWPESAPAHGKIVDLSPRGLQFESNAPIGVFQILKLKGPLLDAVGLVANCRDLNGSFAIGVQFYTVRFNQRRGTFLSTSA